MPSPTGEYDGRRVVVAGLGVSGRAAALALLAEGADVVAVDARSGPQEGAVAEELRAAGAQVRVGDAESAVDTDLIVTSPGWRPDQPLLVQAQREGIEVIGEPELAWRLRPRRPAGAVPWLAVTGTNGKTTTVGMVAAILSAAGLRTVAAGNVGRPLVEVVRALPAYDVIAVELSSFQLHWSRDLAPVTAALLNLAPDHLDWHGSFDAYAADKAKVWRARGAGVYNADDPAVTTLATAHLDDPHPFTLAEPAPGGFGVMDGAIVARLGDRASTGSVAGTRDGATVLAELSDLSVPGPHNLANAVAAAAVCGVAALTTGIRVPPAAVREGLSAYRPGSHRNEIVATGHGVTWVDDSKATNPHAAGASLAAYPSVVWLAGGLLKGADVDEVVAEHAPRLRAVVLIGRDRAAFVAALARHAPDVPVVEVAATDTGGMDDAVRLAAELAGPGDTVLLAPASASMDMFRDYAERGDRFADAARAAAGRA